MTTVAACCGPLPERFVGEPEEIPELAARLRPLPSPPGYLRRFACRRCGQPWEAHRTPFRHAEVTIVVRAGTSPELP